MSLDELKITVLRAAKPGDVVFFNMAPPKTLDERKVIEAMVDYLRPTGIIPIVLPDTIRMVGTIFEPPAPPQFGEGERQSYLKTVGHARASGLLGTGDKTDLYQMYTRMWPNAPYDVRMQAVITDLGILSPQTADSPDPASKQSTDAHDTGPSAG